MLEVFLILTIALLPTILTILLKRKMEDQARSRLRSAIAAAERRHLQQLLARPRDQHYIDGIGALVGDFTCRFNARSPYIRCAVNPSGPCESCRFYESNIQVS